MGYELLITLEHADEGIVATCDELNSVAPGSAEEEALSNLRQAIDSLLETYGVEMG